MTKKQLDFSTRVCVGIVHNSDKINELIGFVPTAEQCESLSMKQLRTPEVKKYEDRYVDEITVYLNNISDHYLEILFDEPILTYLGVEYEDEDTFTMIFDFTIYGTYYVIGSENRSDYEIRQMVDDLVFEQCECKL